MHNACRRGIEYVESIGVFIYESDTLFLTDVEAWKCSYQIGVVSLVVYTLNDEY
jgi:hypothetical protein